MMRQRRKDEWRRAYNKQVSNSVEVNHFNSFKQIF